jgi:hypothetical protein
MHLVEVLVEEHCDLEQRSRRSPTRKRSTPVYHYGSLENALLAALDLTSAERMARYRAALDKAESLEQLLRAARRIYREDTASGHVAVVVQMVAGSVGRPELSAGVLARMETWIEFCEEAIGRFLADSPLAALAPRRDFARAIVVFYPGANLTTHLDPKAGIDTLLARLQQIVASMGG